MEVEQFKCSSSSRSDFGNFCFAWRAAISSLFSWDGPDFLPHSLTSLSPGTGSLPTSGTGPGRTSGAPLARVWIVTRLCSLSGPSLRKHTVKGVCSLGSADKRPLGWIPVRHLDFTLILFPGLPPDQHMLVLPHPSLTRYHLTVWKQVQLVSQAQGGELGDSLAPGWLLLISS